MVVPRPYRKKSSIPIGTSTDNRGRIGQTDRREMSLFSHCFVLSFRVGDKLFDIILFFSK